MTASARALTPPDPAVVADARRWMADCTDTDVQDLDLTDDEVLACIDREYVGSCQRAPAGRHSSPIVTGATTPDLTYPATSTHWEPHQ